jgi:hypothetical protein
MGRRFDEATVFRLARAFERETGWRVEPPLGEGDGAGAGAAGATA